MTTNPEILLKIITDVFGRQIALRKLYIQSYKALEAASSGPMHLTKADIAKDYRINEEIKLSIIKKILEEILTEIKRM